MAAVINLDTVRLTRHIDKKLSRQVVSAEIILFPGIRYERWDTQDENSFNTTPGPPEKLVLSKD